MHVYSRILSYPQRQNCQTNFSQSDIRTLRSSFAPAYAGYVRGQGGGPKSATGKRTASRNALKTCPACPEHRRREHTSRRDGLRSDEPIIPGESADEWHRHVRGIIDSIQPVGYLEEYLATVYATLLWRSQRVVLFEVGAITSSIERAAEGAQIAQAYAQGTLSKGILPEVSGEQIVRQAWRRMLPSDEDIDKIMRGACPEPQPKGRLPPPTGPSGLPRDRGHAGLS